MTSWEKCAAFHGHECVGLTIGYKAALYAIELLELTFSADEQVVCISENDACGVDAIQVLLGCSAGKGNLLFHLRGKSAYNFYNRTTGKSVRLVMKEKRSDLPPQDAFAYYQALEPSELFEVRETTLAVPEKARMFRSYRCDRCGEIAGENWIRLQGEEKLCLDCYESYNRFDV